MEKVKETITVEKGVGKYYVRVNYKDINTGKLRRRKVDEAPTKEEAIEVSKKYVKYLENGGSISKQLYNQKVTLGECILRTIEKAHKKKRKRAGNKYILSKQLYNRHIKGKLGDVYIQRLKTSMIQDFLDKKADKYERSTVKDLKILIENGVKYALQNDIIDRNVMIGVEVYGKEPSSPLKDDFLNIQELKEILEDTKGTELGLQIMLASSYGLKISEVMGLTWNNIDLENRTMKINQRAVANKEGKYIIEKFPKNKEEKVFEISDLLYDALNEYKKQCNKKILQIGSIKEEQLLFSDNNSNPISPNYVTAKFKRYMVKRGCGNITFDKLRHTFATMLYDMEYPLEMIGKMLNYKNPDSATKKYVHLSDKRIAKIINEIANSLLE